MTPDDDKPRARHRRTARLAVAAAALALGGVVLAAWARFSALHAADSAAAEATAEATRLGELLQTAVTTTRMRAAGLAALPAVRAAIETDVATVRDMAGAEGFGFKPGPGETIELFQVPHAVRPVSLLRVPERARPLPLSRADEVRLDVADGGLQLTVAAPSEPLYAHGRLRGAVAVATHVDLAPLFAATAASGVPAELVGLADAVPLSSAPLRDGVRTVAARVAFAADRGGDAPVLEVRAAVAPGGGAPLWAGRLVLIGALALALLALVEHRRRRDDAVEAPAEAELPASLRPTRPLRPPPPSTTRGAATLPIEVNAPTAAMPLSPTTREKRFDGERHLVLAWSNPMPTPITQLKPLSSESAPIMIETRSDELAGRYRLLQPLGRGATADVYLAQSFVPGVPGTVALKMLAHLSPDERARYVDAARRQSRVTHPNVVQVHDVGADEFAYVAMEYVEGCTLEQLLREIAVEGEPLPLSQSVAIVRALCRALDAAQEARDDRGARRPLVHGSVKPSNVLIGRHNVIKLGDFGAPPSPNDRHAPEQYAGRTPDRRSDLYAVGLILHELVTGRRALPPTGDVKQWPPLPAPSTIRPELPRALDAVVAKATRFGPRGRFGTAGELLFELERATADAVNAAAATVLGDWVERARRSS